MFDLVTAIVALVFAIWFWRAADRAGRSALDWALLGGALAAAMSIAVPAVVLFVVRKAAGDISPTATFVVGGVSWLLGILAALAVGSGVLPEPSQEKLRVLLAAQEATSDQATGARPDSLSCVRCGSAVRKADALRLGAIRIDDRTCICPACKGAPRSR